MLVLHFELPFLCNEFYKLVMFFKMNIILQTVGDAISDLLVVETVLRQRDWSCSEWDTAYTDLPSRQIKVKVRISFRNYLISIENSNQTYYKCINLIA